MNNNGKDFLYEKVKNGIESEIQKGNLKEGQQIPTEAELGLQFGVSRVTVRRAIADLIENNTLQTKRGKGTYVISRRIDHLLLAEKSFTEVCKENDKVASSKILQISIQRPDKDDMRIFGVKPDEMILFIKRVRFADGIPVLIEYNNFAPRYIPLINYNLENASIYEILRKDFGMGALATETTIQISKVTAEDARELQIKPNNPVLLTCEANRDYDTGEPVHHTKQYIIGDGWVYKVSSKRE
jgi:GntR family transcriptional regulator